jgi:hypothetical protein
MKDDLMHKVNSLKSILKEAERYLDDQMREEDKIPENKTESMKDLLELTNKKTKSRKVTKTKKVKKTRDIKKSVSTLKSLIDEVTEGIDRGRTTRNRRN